MFEFTYEATGGLRIIPQIPDCGICRIEGRNGVGKTLALRLLELATGEQPYLSEEAAWSSLRSNLQWVRLKVTNLPNGRSLEWSASPGEWPENAELPREEWIGSYQIDGERATFAEARSLLRIRRVSGDRTITNFILAKIGDDIESTERLRARLTAESEVLRKELDDLAAQLRRLDAGGFAEAQQKLMDLDANASSLEKRRGAQLLAATALEAANSVRAASLRLGEELPDVEAAITTVERAIIDLDSDKGALQKELEALDATLVKAKQAQNRLKQARQRLEREERAATKALDEQDLLERKWQADVGAPCGDEEDERRTLLEQQRSLRQEALLYSKMPRLRSLADEVADVLSGQEATGLEEETFIEEPGDWRLTVGDLKTRVNSRSIELAAMIPSARALEIEREEETIEGRLFTLKWIVEGRALVQRTREALQSTEKLVRDLIAESQPDAAGKYAEVGERLNVAESARREKVAERATLMVQQGILTAMGDAQDLAERIRSLSAEWGAPDQWQERLGDERRKAILLEGELAKTNEQREALASKRDEFRAVCSSELPLARSRRPWLLTFLGLDGSAEIEDLVGVLGAVRALLQKVEGAKERLDELGGPVANVTGRLKLLRRNLSEPRTPRNSDKADAYSEGVGAHYSEVFGEYFGQRHIRAALFEGGDFERLDLQNLALHWVTREGERRSRPLEAFSSGERAFAYTLASIQDMKELRAGTRILALDEFGAFVARDRFDQLVRFLREQVLGKIADRVLIVLPVTRDYIQADLDESELSVADKERRASMKEMGYVAYEEDGTAWR